MSISMIVHPSGCAIMGGDAFIGNHLLFAPIGTLNNPAQI